MKLQAKRAPGFPKRSILVIYGDQWETCEGSEGLLMDELDELRRSWFRDDRKEARRMGHVGNPHEYRIVPE